LLSLILFSAIAEAQASMSKRRKWERQRIHAADNTQRAPKPLTQSDEIGKIKKPLATLLKQRLRHSQSVEEACFKNYPYKYFRKRIETHIKLPAEKNSEAMQKN